jgi:hypothetical protein
MKELIDFLNNYNVNYTIENGCVVANEIDLSQSGICELPENIHLIKCNYLFLDHNRISKLPENLHLFRCHWIDLSHNQISELPENLHLINCNYLNLGNNQISELPENLHLIKCRYLYLYNNKLNKLPENFHLIKCRYLDLSYNKINKLPENFHLLKCKYLYLSNNLSCSHQYFDEIEITKEYIHCDGILMWYDVKKQIGDYIVYIGRFGEVVVTKDNKTFAHGDTLRQAISDLSFKLSDRDKNDYIDIDKNVQYPINDMIVMYRIITGACSFGVENFMTGKKFNETISLNEINAIIGNEYGSKSFREFFEFK